MKLENIEKLKILIKEKESLEEKQRQMRGKNFSIGRFWLDGQNILEFSDQSMVKVAEQSIVQYIIGRLEEIKILIEGL